MNVVSGVMHIHFSWDAGPCLGACRNVLQDSSMPAASKNKGHASCFTPIANAAPQLSSWCGLATSRQRATLFRMTVQAMQMWFIILLTSFVSQLHVCRLHSWRFRHQGRHCMLDRCQLIQQCRGRWRACIALLAPAQLMS